MNFLKKHFFSLGLLMVLFTACSDTELDPKHYMVATLDDALFTRVDNFSALSQTMYEELNSVFTDPAYMALQNLPSMAVSTTSNDKALLDLDLYQWEADNPLIEDVWQKMFKVLSHTNLVISELEGYYKGDKQAEVLLLEMRFLRVLYLFETVVMFGEVPMPISPIFNTSDLNDVNLLQGDAMWDFMFTELGLASELPKNQANQLKANYWAVKALEGKMYLFRAKQGADNTFFNKAYKAFSEVLNSGQFILEKQYEKLFNSAQATDIEPLFYTKFFTNEPLLKSDIDSKAIFKPSENLLSLYTNQDSRYTTVVDASVNESSLFKKYTSTDSGTPFYVLRLADIWLLHSEILEYILPNDRARLTGINLVRERVNTSILSNEITTEDFFKNIQLERERELVLEGKSLYDYRRWGLEVMQKLQPTLTIEQKHMTFPIPNSVLTDTQLDWYVQHKGY